jgi:hypothetical protein
VVGVGPGLGVGSGLGVVAGVVGRVGVGVGGVNIVVYIGPVDSHLPLTFFAFRDRFQRNHCNRNQFWRTSTFRFTPPRSSVG